MDILLGADMIHLFPKLDYTVEKLSLYMSFLTQRYIVMGQLPDNAPEEQLAAIRRFSEEHSGAGLRLINLPRRSRSHRGGEPHRGRHLEVLVEEEPPATTQLCPGQRWNKHSWHHQLLMCQPDRPHHPQMCLQPS